MSTSLVSARPRVSKSPSVLIVLLLALCAGAFSQQAGSHASQIWRSEPKGITINHVSALAAPLRTARTLRGDGSTVAPPTISKAFGASSIPLNGTTSLTFTISNPNTTVDLSGVTFSDTLPNTTGTLAVASTPGVTNTCGGTVTATAGAGVISLYGGSLTRSTSCTLSVDVTGTAAGDAVNTTGTISSTESGTGLTSSLTA